MTHLILLWLLCERGWHGGRVQAVQDELGVHGIPGLFFFLIRVGRDLTRLHDKLGRVQGGGQRQGGLGVVAAQLEIVRVDLLLEPLELVAQLRRRRPRKGS